MDKVRRAEEHEIQSLPVLTRYGRLGSVFSIRTDGAAYEGASLGSIDSGCAKNTTPSAPSQSEDADSDVIFTPEAANLLKASESRTTYLARTGVIPAFKVGKKEWRYSRRALEEWLQMQAKKCLDLPALIPTPSIPKPSMKPKVTKKRREIPTDLSPEALRKAMKSIRPTRE